MLLQQHCRCFGFALRLFTPHCNAFRFLASPLLPVASMGLGDQAHASAVASPRWLVFAHTNRFGNIAMRTLTQGITTNQWPR